MADAIWKLVIGTIIVLIYLSVALIFWSAFSFVANPVLQIAFTFSAVLFFHNKMIYKGNL